MTDHANWMNDSGIRNLPLRRIVFPGTHDSGTYALTRDSPIAPGADTQQFVLDLQQKFSSDPTKLALFMSILAGWMKAQDLSITDQLQSGIRYLDLRVYQYQGELWLVHTMYQTKLSDAMSQISAFVSAHPTEILVLYFQHLYDLSTADHDRVVSMLPPNLIPAGTDLNISVGTLVDHKTTVLAVYNDDYAATSPGLWPGSTLIIPWPEGMETTQQVLEFLEQQVASAAPGAAQLFGLVGTITPDETIVENGLAHQQSGQGTAPENLQQLAQTINQPFLDWVQSLDPSRPVSFAILDWFEQVALVDAVIAMNRQRM